MSTNTVEQTVFLVRVVTGSIQVITLWPVITCIFGEPKYGDLYHQQLWAHYKNNNISLTQQIFIEFLLFTHKAINARCWEGQRE